MSVRQIVIICVIMMLVLALSIVFFVILYQRRVINHQIQMREFNRQKQLELMQASIRGEEEERTRIASELHDDVGATLSSVRLFLHKAVRNPTDIALISQTTELLDESIQKVRDLSHQLQPGSLQYLGLPRSLQSLCELINRSGSMRMECTQHGDWPEPDAHTALSLYRIVQELVNNIVKHAEATCVSMSICSREGRHCISISHDGNGLTEEDYQKHLFKKGAIGLKNIENRLKSASLSIFFPEPEEDNYTITLCLPPYSAHSKNA